jgi:hypothetical protein
MNREDIIRMAREAGMPPVEITSDKPVLYPVPDAIERFAALVAADEREACAAICDAFEFSPAANAIRARGKT